MKAVRIKRADWLIWLSVLGSLLTVWLVVTGIDVLLQLMHQFGYVGKNGFTTANAIAYVAMTTPRRLYEMFSHAALIGGLLGLGGLAGTGELTALRASGMSRMRIAMSAAGVIAVLVVAVVILGETLAPWGDQKAQAMQLRMRAANVGQTNSGLWARDGDRVINVKNTLIKQVNGRGAVQLEDVRVYAFTPDGQVSRFDWAKSADHDGHQWRLHGVRSTTLDDKGTHATTAATMPWQSSLNPSVLEQSVIQPEYLPMRDLRRNMRYLEANGQNPGIYAVPFWGRVLYPLNVLVLVLCAMPFAFGTLRSGGLGKRLFIGMLLAVGWYFLQKAMVNFGSVYGIPPLLANLLPAVLLSVGAWLYFRRGQH